MQNREIKRLRPRQIDIRRAHDLGARILLEERDVLRRHAAGRPLRLLDVGSGGGLPGVVFAICCPELSVDCVDTNNLVVERYIGLARYVYNEAAATESSRTKTISPQRFRTTSQ